MAELQLPGALVTLFPGTPRRLTLEGATVGELLANLDVRVPGMHDRLLVPGPAIRQHIKVFVDGSAAGLATPVGPAAVVHVITAISGG